VPLIRRRADDSVPGADASAASDGGTPPAARVLTAGAKSAERVARATGVDRVVNDAVEEAIVRALRSPAVLRAIERAIEESHVEAAERRSDEIAQVVRRVLQSDTADKAWTEFLQSDQAQMLVERIAGAPEVRAAIASQGAGLITDIGVRLTVISERLDDTLERVVRADDPDSETNQAGLATRAIAAGVDLALLFAGYSLVSGLLASVFSAVFGDRLPLAAIIVLWVLGVVVGGAIFAAFWALAGQTPGMRFLSIRLEHRGSREITARCAVRRVFAVILSLLPFGLGYLAILRDPQRRAWADRMTDTEVIYDVGARSAPHAGWAGSGHTAAHPRRARVERRPQR
jgi:uncharacterized RDD family membrane protein YckC